MALQDFSISFTTTPVVEFNNLDGAVSPLSSLFADLPAFQAIGMLGTVFGDLPAFQSIGMLGTLFADLPAFQSVGMLGTISAATLCANLNVLRGPFRSILAGPNRSLMSCG